MNRILCLMLSVVAAGCSSSPPPDASVGRASGTVTLDGQPLAGGKIEFVSAAATASTPIGPDGQFEIPQLAAGTYKVAVSTGPDPSGSKKASSALFRQGEKGTTDKATPLPKRYADPQTSKLEVTIDAAVKPLEIKLTSK